MRTFVLERLDGGVMVMRLLDPESTPLQEVQKWPADLQAQALFPGTQVRATEIDNEAVPTDRTFRDAWRWGGARIEHDMAKARDIQRERMRQARAPKLAALDAAYLRADERADAAEKLRVAALKQELRDVTAIAGLEAAATPEALKAVWPDCLK